MEFNSKRLIIRPLMPNDRQAFFNYRSDKTTNKYQGWVPNSLQDVDEFIAKLPSEFNKPDTWFQWAIEKKDSKMIIGDLGIHFIGKENNLIEIGCTLSKAEIGKGYATEALKEVINHAFYKWNKHRIIASIDPENDSSIRLMERLGFRKEAHFVESLYLNNQWVDDVVYALLERDWEKKKLSTNCK